ncbi:MAG: acyl-CoA dehydrogenase family protein [Acidobacteria bacterium]|nr:acyl-CoA dehydrogenase family protein [Acidobacteriota bacterium]
MTVTEENVETLDVFGSRARAWIEANLPSWDDDEVDSHTLQNLLFDNGFAGIAFPREYGGAGLTLAHQKVFYDTAAELRRQVPSTYMVSIGMMAPTILDSASHEAKLRFLPKALRGDETWMQLLSEPRGGSDMAGSTTRLTRDGDIYVLNGAKMWSSGAYESTYGLCLCRSDWNAPKHRGLSMIAVPLQGTPGLELHRTRAANGNLGEFCEESFVDVQLPVDNLIGEESKGWSVAQTLLFHERNAVANIGYGYLGRTAARSGSAQRSNFGVLAVPEMVERARARGGSPEARQAIADAFIEETVLGITSGRIMAGMRVGTHKGQWGSMLKLQGSVAAHERARTALVVSGADGVIWDGDEVRIDNPGTTWLGCRGGTLAGGSNEMQRNIVSERLLGLPREPSFDRDLPFNEVIRNQGKL